MSGREGASSRATAKHGSVSGRASLTPSEQRRELNTRLSGGESSEGSGVTKRQFRREGSRRGEIAKTDESIGNLASSDANLRAASVQGRVSNENPRRRDSLGTSAITTSTKKKVRVVGRAASALSEKEKEASVARGRSSHRQKAQTVSPPAVNVDAPSGKQLSTSGSAACAASAGMTGPPSARTSAVVEAFLLRMQNCLSKQELLFRRLDASLAEMNTRPPAFLAAASSSSWLQRRPLSPSPASGTGSDGEAHATSLHYSVATPTETILQAGGAGDEPSRNAQHKPQVSFDSASPSGAHDVELMPSFDTQVHPLSAPLTPSCSVVVVHPTLERVIASAPSHFLELQNQPPHPTSVLTSPNYLRLENIEVPTSSSATPSNVSDQLALLSSSVSETPSSPVLLRSTQGRRVASSPNSAVPATAAPSPPPQPVISAHAPTSLLARHRTATDAASHRYGPQPHLDADREGGVHRQGSRVSAAAPPRRSSAVQWEGEDELRRTPPSMTPGNAAAARSSEGTSPFLKSTSPPCSAFNPPPLPTLLGVRRSLSSPFNPGEPHGTWMMSPPGATAGGSLRLTTVSNALSVLTSIDSVTLSPLSRPMSTWGGSPMTRSMHGGGSPVQPHQQSRQPHQLPQGAMLTMSGSFSATGGGTPASTRSPSGTVGRSSGGSPQPRRDNLDRNGLQISPSAGNVDDAMTNAAGVSSPPISDSTSYSPVLYNFVSPPGAAAIPSNELPRVLGRDKDLRSLQLQPNALSSTSPAASNRSANATAGNLPAPPQMVPTLSDVRSPLSPSSSSPSSTPATMSRRTSAAATRTSAKFASTSLSHFNSSCVSTYSLDDEARRSTSEPPQVRAVQGQSSTKGSGGAPTLPTFPERGEAGGEAGSHTPHCAAVSVHPPSSDGGGSKGMQSTTDVAAGSDTLTKTAPEVAPTHRQLALSASPSVERTSREGVHADEAVGDAPHPVHDSGDGLCAVSASDTTVSSDDGAALVEQQPALAQRSQSVPPLNPFAIPPPPSSLSELHGHQQRRRMSAAPVPTMRRPPMAPPRRSNSVDDTAGTFKRSGVESDSVSPGTAPQDGSGDRAAHLEQWLSFERQHEQMHLPACWRDSEVVVVDHVEEEDRERDAETQEQLRLLEADLMSGWQASPSSSEREDSQTRGETERRRLERSTRRHSYPGSSSDKDRPPFSGSEMDSNGNLGDEWEWDDEAEPDGSYKGRVAQSGQPALPHQRRRRHSPWHRSSNTITTGAGAAGEPWAGAGELVGRRRGRRLPTGESGIGTDAASPSAGVARAVDGATDGRQRDNSPTSAAGSTAEPAESHRAFRRGHSAPTVVSDGGMADWQSLRARFDELVTIQQRVRTREEDDGVAEAPEGSLGAAGRGQSQRRDSEFGGPRLGKEAVRSRRHRDRGGSSRGPSAAFSAQEGGAVTRSAGFAGAPFARYLPSALSTEERNGDDSPPAAVSTSSASVMEDKSRRRTEVFQDGAQRTSDAAATHAEPRSVGSSPTQKAPCGPAQDATAAQPNPDPPAEPTGQHKAATPEATAEQTEGTRTPSPESARDAVDEGADGALATNTAARLQSERRSCSAPVEQRLTYEARAALDVASPSEGGPSPDRHGRSGVTAIRKDPPAFLSASPPTFTVDASHTTGRAAAATATTAGTAATALDAIHLREERDALDDAVKASGSDASGNAGAAAIGVDEEDGAAPETSSPTGARPVRTPRLRFTSTPRVAGRLNTRGRGRRAVVLHSAVGGRGGTAKRGGEAEVEVAAGAPLSTPSNSSAARRLAAPQERPAVRKKKSASATGVPGRGAGRLQSKPPHATSPRHEGAAAAATVAAEEPRPSHNAPDGGEVVEPVPPAPTTAVATASPRVTTTPRDDAKGARGASAAKATPPSTVVRVRLPAAESDVRTEAAARREKQREKKEEETALHRPAAADSRRMSDLGNGAAEAAATTTESRALLRRLAQRKDRTRAMEERLRLSSGNFTSIGGALALPTAAHTAALEGEESAGADSTASTPMRSALRLPAHAEAAPAPEPEEASHTSTTATTPLTAPLTLSPEGRSGPAPVSRSNSDSRHVVVVEPSDGPSVTFATGPTGGPSQNLGSAAAATPHPSHAAAAMAKANTRRRLVDVRSRPTASAAGKHGGPSAASRTPSSVSPTAAASSSAAAPAAAGATGSGTVHTFKRGDSLRTHQRTSSPPSSSLAQERRRHTIGDAPFSAMSEKRLRPTRTALHS